MYAQGMSLESGVRKFFESAWRWRDANSGPIVSTMTHDHPENEKKPTDADSTDQIAEIDLERVSGGAGIQPQELKTPTKLKTEWITSIKGE